MFCRKGCAACCIVVSISSPLPGMPEGKPAGVRCVNLTDENYCRIHGAADYPTVCRGLSPRPEMCGRTNGHAFAYLARLEKLTAPVRTHGSNNHCPPAPAAVECADAL
jgi:Fe-S-cluster containining protein